MVKRRRERGKIRMEIRRWMMMMMKMGIQMSRRTLRGIKMVMDRTLKRIARKVISMIAIKINRKM